MRLSLAEVIDEVMESLPDLGDDTRRELARALATTEADRVRAVRRVLERAADRPTHEPVTETPDG